MRPKPSPAGTVAHHFPDAVARGGLRVVNETFGLR
jgi:hypothetical protein